MLTHGSQQAVLGEWLRQVLARANHASTRTIEQAVLRRQHYHGCSGKTRTALDERAGLVTIEARHQDVAEDDVRRVVVDLRERFEAVLREDDLAAGLCEENLRTAPNGVRII